MHSVINKYETSNLSHLGLTHIAVSIGSKDNVDHLTNKLDNAGYKVLNKPRTTGDGYYESCVLDPEGNQIEITI